MKPHPLPARLAFCACLLLLAGLACSRSQDGGDSGLWSVSYPGTPTVAARGSAAGAPDPAGEFAPQRTPGGPLLTPTPDAPHTLPPLRTTPEIYAVQAGDTLGIIAGRFGVSVEQIIQDNEISDPNLLAVGQTLNIPVPTPDGRGPGFKILPDSELVFGPASVLFKTDEFVQQQGGFLSSYKEAIGDQSWSGAQIVQRVAQDYSVNPRLLLAALEYQSGWVTHPNPPAEGRSGIDLRQYPLGIPDPQRKGLYRQLAWVANNFNRGYYLWQAGGVGAWLLGDGSIVPIDPTINAGTAGVQEMFALLDGHSDWEQDVSPKGLFATYNTLFGYPFDYAFEPLLPPNLQQPVFQLPFEAGTRWSFTGGPHGGWGDGSAWAALDFGPPGEALGCVSNDAWVTAIANGPVVRTGDGAVIQDLDLPGASLADGFEQTGWVALYMHVEMRERVLPGTYLKTGDRIGHPSCEGGVSNGTHLHIARRYNGEWLPADRGIPFVMDGWTASGAGREYDGYLMRNGQSIEAYAGNSPDNEIGR